VGEAPEGVILDAAGLNRPSAARSMGIPPPTIDWNARALP